MNSRTRVRNNTIYKADKLPIKWRSSFMNRPV